MSCQAQEQILSILLKNLNLIEHPVDRILFPAQDPDPDPDQVSQTLFVRPSLPGFRIACSPAGQLQGFIFLHVDMGPFLRLQYYEDKI